MNVIIITKETHPSVFDIFLRIDYNNGAVNRYEPEATEYSIPQEYAGKLSECESALASLTDGERDTLCCGDEDEAFALIRDNPGLNQANELINGYFEGWIK